MFEPMQDETSRDIIDALEAGWSFPVTRPRYETLLDRRLAASSGRALPPVARPLAVFERVAPDALERFAAGLTHTSIGPVLVEDATGDGSAAILSAVRRNHDRATLSPGHLDRLEDGLEYLRARNPATHAAIAENLLAVAFLSDVRSSSFSIARLIGFVFLSNRPDLDAEDIALLLIHEMAHTELNLLTLFDDLFAPDALRGEAYAPFQQKMRGPVGRIHAAHAVYRMLQFAGASGSKHAEGLRSDFAATLATLEDVETTPLGSALIHRFYRAALTEETIA